MAIPRRLLRQKLRDLEQASDYATWREVALELDRIEGSDDWRADETSGDYDYLLIKERLTEMRALRRKGDVRKLVFNLHEGLHGNLGNMANPALHAVARVGTKHLIEQYAEEVARCLDYICVGSFPDFADDEKILFFKRTGTVFGRSALMLSGGATLGLFHLGVIKALWENSALPRVVSGSSAGAIIAGMAGTRTDAQMPEIFDPDGLQLQAFQRLSFKRALSGGALMDAKVLEQCLEANVGDQTFGQAFDRTRRIIGIPVSPAELHQQARLLNYLTAPNVLIRRALLASCAVPGVFPPVMLQARDYEGRVVPYMPSKRWVDGTLSSDLPMLRLARLHNVNHYIVSQTNPHIVPFMRAGVPKAGFAPFARELVQTSGRHALELARQHMAPYYNGGFVSSKLYSVIRQRYTGDVNLFPRHSPRQLMRMFANPTPEDIRRFLRDGERATWPKIERIRIQTRISRAFESCLMWMKAQDRAPPPQAVPARRKLRAVS